MAMNVSYLRHVAPRLKVLGLCHSVYWTMVGLCELVDVPFEEVLLLVGGCQPPGLGAALGARRTGPLPAAGRTHRRGPGTAPAGPRRHVPAARLLPHRDQRAFQRVRPVVPAPPRRGRAPAAQRSASTSRSARRTSPSTSAFVPRSRKPTPSRSMPAPPNTPRRSSIRSRPAPCGSSPPTSSTTD